MIRNSLHKQARAGLSMLALSALMASTAAQAVVTESAKVVKTIGKYSAGGFFQNPVTNTTTAPVNVVLGSNPGFAPELGINVTATATDQGAFFFEHNLWRIGKGSAEFDTTVTTTLTNTGPDAVSMLFESLITPGYIAIAGPVGSYNAASFDFSVRQVTDGVSTPLYFALGLASPGALPLVNTSSGSLKGLTSYQNATTFALTWEATPLFLQLAPIAPGSSTTIVYDLVTRVFGDSNGSLCEGSQVAFGDPRNPGGAARSAFRSPVPTPPCTTEPVIGKLFDPAVVPVNISVPEPASWAMLISGFGLTGAAMRRRRAMVAQGA
jgi:hypothetical protein